MKKIIILGAGESGVGAAILAVKKGFEVFVSDKGKIKEKYKNVLSNAGVEWEEEKHTLNRLLKADEVIKSPGIPDDTEELKKIKAKNIPVISEIEFASRFSTSKKICITGSNGKTTTSTLIHHILNKAGWDVCLAGNVGKSFAGQLAESDHEYFVLELSSFQLDGMYEFRADIAVLLNITPDHLDRYDNDFQKYADSKFRITRNQKEEDYFIYCDDDEVIKSEINKRKLKQKLIPFSIQHKLETGGFVNENEYKININQTQFRMLFQELALQGKHNLYNSLASGIAARILDIRKDVIKESLSDFQGVEHRLEFVANIHGIEFINDSKATNVNSAWYALESMTKPVIWIVGGKDKGNDYSLLNDMVKSKVKAIVCLGLDNKKIIKNFKGIVENIAETYTAIDAVRTAYHFGKQGDVVLLSPACASFDLFENYEERGKKFKEAVRDF
ncbi:MAG TPA: UDP-N-acetylmuramoyl-L-alanine--D-glutamate ligase [Bacteroidales bacterium]|nr:UDP-N-acetylmuramoyl-L-alanine--D-glutamate ligase [Bacteroidales bacterium]HPS16393.1 UDP-N-acetylmuramoyl-L-alanine--D-glutamate ligase [Bacteroidales bacterium]